MSDIENKKFSVSSKTQQQNLVKISDNSDYSIYYIIDRRDFNLEKGIGTNGIAKVIFFSKMYNKGILINFKQMIYHAKTNIYNISLHTGANDKYMFVSSMAVLDKDFNYEYFIKYYYMQSPPSENGVYKSWITIQDTKNYCNLIDIDLRDNVIYENINDIPRMPGNNIEKKCTPIIYDMDLKDFFPENIIK